MAALWLAAVVLGVSLRDEPPTVALAPTVGVENETWLPSRTGRELLEAAHATLARWARPTDAEADLAAREYLARYRELDSDLTLAPSQRDPLLSKIRGRLASLQRQIEKRVAIQRRLAKEGKRPSAVDAVPWQNNVLAQWGGMMPGGMMGGGTMGGGPAQSADNSQELIDLIQQVIAPSTWDVNGGAGSIYYWRPGRALVIRNSTEVHNQIGDLMDQLNRLGQ